ncbi:MAG TPA: FtsX-like permease family protein [Clostridiales bacterium]|nr:FtsX-like permease family protein [Clostridiales bacterium]
MYSEKTSEFIYMGYADSTAVDLQNWSMLKGTMPTAADEVAIQEKTYYSMGITNKVGERVTLQINTSDGVISKEYTLTGIMHNYGTYIDKFGTDIPKAPQVITGENSSTNMCVNIYYDDTSDSLVDFGGEYNKINANVDSRSINSINTISISLTVFFLLLTCLGIHNIVKVTYKEREQYIGLMRCIGLKRGQAYRVFLLQGIVMAVIACAVGCGIGIAVYLLAVAIMNAIGTAEYLFILSTVPFLVSVAICLVVVVGSFAVQMLSFSKRAPLDYNTIKLPKNRRSRRKSKTFVALWGRVYSKSNRSQMIMSIALIASCMALLCFGFFYGEIQPMGRYYYDMLRAEETKEDFRAFVSSGSNDAGLLYINVPRGSGLSKEQVKEINDNENLSVDFCNTGVFTSTYLLVDDKAQCQSVQDYVKNAESLIQMGGHKDTRKSMEAAGYSGNQELYGLITAAVPTDQLSKLEPALLQGEIDTEKFNSGEQIAVLGDYFKVGDSFTISYVTYTTKINDDRNEEVPTIHNFDVTVGAVYDSAAKVSVLKGLQDAASKNCIIMNDNVLMAVDPTLSYENVSIKYTGDIKDKQAIDDARMYLNMQASNGVNVSITDYLGISEKWNNIVTTYTTPVIFIVSVFMLIILLSLMMVNSVKVKSNLKSYALLRAIGMDKQQLSRIIIRDTLKHSIIGILIGGVSILGFITVVSMSATLPYASVLINTVIPVALIGAGAVILVSLLSCILPVRWVMKQDVSTSIDTIKY